MVAFTFVLALLERLEIGRRSVPLRVPPGPQRSDLVTARTTDARGLTSINKRDITYCCVSRDELYQQSRGRVYVRVLTLIMPTARCQRRRYPKSSPLM